MSPAALSLAALLVAFVISMTSSINVGWLAIALAWLIGVYSAGLRPDAVMAGFPATLFLTLVGVTLLFAIAETNGTIEALSLRATRLARRSVRTLPVVLFAVACALSSVGPGAVSTVALLMPFAMAAGTRTGLSPLLVALMVANGANAGNLSPFSSVGVIANGAMAKAGLVGFEGRVWFANFAAHLIVAFAAFVWLARRVAPIAPAASEQRDDTTALSRQHLMTLGMIGLWMIGVLAFQLNLGLSAVAAAILLLLARAADESIAVKRMPWGIIMMVCGVSLLIGVLERTGGMDLFTDLMARIASAETLNGVIAFITGSISTYSSTSGVVLPAFLPTVSTLVNKVGGGDPLAVALSINVGSSLVDVSPLSTIGALCVAAVTDSVAGRRLFRALLIWGLSMTIVGAILCQLFAPMLARW